MLLKKPTMSFWQIVNMNVGFFGIQYSFGLQQTAINPFYTFLHTRPEDLPLLNLAGPVTSLLIQPLNDPNSVMVFAGVLLLPASAATIRIKQTVMPDNVVLPVGDDIKKRHKVKVKGKYQRIMKEELY